MPESKVFEVSGLRLPDNPAWTAASMFVLDQLSQFIGKHDEHQCPMADAEALLIGTGLVISNLLQGAIRHLDWDDEMVTEFLDSIRQNIQCFAKAAGDS